jgi:hypothetical protein
MTENLRNQRRILDASDAPGFAAAFGTGLDVDRKNAPEALISQHWFRILRAAMGRKRPLKGSPTQFLLPGA